MKGFLNILTGICLFCFSAVLNAQEPVLEWIRNDDTGQIREYLTDHDVDSIPPGLSRTLLIYSVQYGKPGMIKLLIENGADVNLKVGGISPLMYAAGGDVLKKLSLILESGAFIEDADRYGNTAIYYSVSNGNLKHTRYLVRKGAELYHKNHRYLSPYDMAVRNNHQELAAYLRTAYERNLPEFRDGPYVRWTGRTKLQAFYMVHDAHRGITRKRKESFTTNGDIFHLAGFAGDTLDYYINREKTVSTDVYNTVEKLMVIGDVHGAYDSLVVFLRNNKVIDDSLNWIWGDGHLVLVGDVVDRGDKVTEALWLIYRLEDQAGKSGGRVHYVLGNHEIMVMSGDLYYTSDKYLLMCSHLNLDYSLLYGKNTVLGQWLRTRNSIVRINGHLFSHAGLSPELTQTGLDITRINEYVRYFLNHPDEDTYHDIERSALLGRSGPFWYRGYHEDNSEYRHLPEPEFDKVLKYFNARYIFIGHTNVDEISSVYHGRVFALDVPYYTFGHSMYGLLLKGEKIYLLNTTSGPAPFR